MPEDVLDEGVFFCRILQTSIRVTNYTPGTVLASENFPCSHLRADDIDAAYCEHHDSGPEACCLPYVEAMDWVAYIDSDDDVGR